MNAATDAKPRIGFIGLGLMGHGIAKNLVTKGYPLTVRAHRNRKPLEDLLAAGAKEAHDQRRRRARRRTSCSCASPARRRSRRSSTARTASRASRARGSSSSTRRRASRRRRRRCATRSPAHGVLFVDAPLARTPVEAELGKLNIMVGADDATFAALKPVLQAFCENIIHAGPPGHGLMLKLINNFIAQAIATATAEACADRGQVGRFARASCTRSSRPAPSTRASSR